MSTNPSRTCGSCTFCCKVLGIEELSKPAGSSCVHCETNKGCRIYSNRPAECATFICGWLAHPETAEELRPDKSGVMFLIFRDDSGVRLEARCDPADPFAWKCEPTYSILKQNAATTWGHPGAITAVAGYRTWLITPTTEYELGEVGPDTTVRFQKHPDGTASVEVKRQQAAESV